MHRLETIDKSAFIRLQQNPFDVSSREIGELIRSELSKQSIKDNIINDALSNSYHRSLDYQTIEYLSDFIERYDSIYFDASENRNDDEPLPPEMLSAFCKARVISALKFLGTSHSVEDLADALYEVKIATESRLS